MRGRSRRRSAAGQSLVELALILPLLLIFAMGTFDVGRIVFTYLALEDAVQEGATYAAQAPTPAGSLHGRVESRVRSSSDNGDIAAAAVTSPIPCSASAAGTPGTVTVTAVADVDVLTPIISLMFGGTFQLRATVVATNLNGSC